MRVLFVWRWRSAILSAALLAILGALAGCNGNGAPERVTTQACAGASCAPACEEGAAECRPGDRSALCRDGTWTERSCIIACRGGHCVDCAEGEGRCVDAGTAEICVEGVLVTVPCVEEPCRDARCRCRPQSARCSDSGRQLCNEDGLWMDAPCDSERPLCFDEGRCGACAPGERRCLGSDDARVCAESHEWAQEACALGCDVVLGYCRPEDCMPGATRCAESGTVVQRCTEEGRGYEEVQRCDADAGQSCAEGRCVDTCELAKLSLSPAGCHFVAPPIVGLIQDMADSFSSGPKVELHLLNPGDGAADVRVTQAGEILGDVRLSAQGLAVVPVPSGLMHAEYSRRIPVGAIEIRSNRPVYVVQYLSLYDHDGLENALAGDTAFLLPIHVLETGGTRYRVLTQPHRQNHGGTFNVAQPGGFTVVSASPETTRLTLHFRGDTAPGDGLPPALAGETQSVSLAASEAIHFLSQSRESICTSEQCPIAPGENLTGTLIESDQPIAVFNTGMSRVPYATDHHVQAQLLEQLMPVPLWGDRFVVAARTAPGTHFRHEQWVVVTDAAENALRFTPAPPGVVSLPLSNAGDSTQFNTHAGLFAGHRQFEMLSDHPVLVARYAYMPVENRNLGVSSFSLERPIRFWRRQYHVSSVAQAQNRVHLLVPAAATASLDGAAITITRAPGPAGYEVLEIPVEPGAHRIETSVAGALFVYGGDGGISGGAIYPDTTAHRGDAYSYAGPIGFGDTVGGW